MRRLLVVAVVASALPVVACSTGEPSPLEDVRRLSDADNFSSGREATGALATASARLIDEADRCAATARGDDVRCRTLGVAAAWSQVAAVDVARCGRADAQAARATLIRLLDQIDAAEAGGLTEAPSPPALPDCR
jgi:hypothetical protein